MYQSVSQVLGDAAWRPSHQDQHSETAQHHEGQEDKDEECCPLGALGEE